MWPGLSKPLITHTNANRLHSARTICCKLEMNHLIHLPLVRHICVSESGQQWLRQCLVAYSMSSHYLNQCLNIVNSALRNKIQWNLNRNSCIFILENASEKIACQMAAILSRCVNTDLTNEVGKFHHLPTYRIEKSTPSQVYWKRNYKATLPKRRESARPLGKTKTSGYVEIKKIGYQYITRY